MNFPFWELWPVGVAAGALGFWLLRRASRRTTPPPPPQSMCPACQYDVTGLDRNGPCPECGHILSKPVVPHWYTQPLGKVIVWPVIGWLIACIPLVTALPALHIDSIGSLLFLAILFAFPAIPFAVLGIFFYNTAPTLTRAAQDAMLAIPALTTGGLMAYLNYSMLYHGGALGAVGVIFIGIWGIAPIGAGLLIAGIVMTILRR